MRFVVPLLALSLAGLPMLAASAENPVYNDEKLTLPRVDTTGQVGTSSS